MSSVTLQSPSSHTQVVLTTGQASYLAGLGPISSGQYKYATIYQNVSVLTGSSTPTWLCKLQGSMDGTTWDDIGSGGFTNKTGTGTQRIATLDVSGYQSLRLVYSTTGTITAITTDLYLSLKQI